MGRKAHIPLEIDFIFGLDGKGFNRLTNSEQMTYIRLWAYLWHNGKGTKMSVRECQDVLKMCLASVRHLDKYLTNIGQMSLIEYDGEEVKFVGMKEKRDNAFGKKDENSTLKDVKKYKQTVPNRNKNKDENKNTNKNITKTQEYSTDFLLFWEAYPRKTAKKAAYKSWLKVAASQPEICIIAATNYAKFCSDSHTEEKYIKHASTFINQEDMLDWQKPKIVTIQGRTDATRQFSGSGKPGKFANIKRQVIDNSR